MTTTQSSTATTTPIRHVGRAALSTSYDFTDLDTSTKIYLLTLQSAIGPVIKQWWDSLTSYQRLGLSERGLSLKISASFNPALDPAGNPVKE